MTEPAPGGGSDPSMIRTTAKRVNRKWIINGRKWYITGAGEAAHFILVAKTGDAARDGLTAFFFVMIGLAHRAAYWHYGTGGARRALRTNF